jgi:hypothetical protein
MNIPSTFLNHPGVSRVVAGDDQGSDCKYWVFLKDGWGFYENGERRAHCWINGGFGVDSVAEFKSHGLELLAN